MNENILRTMFKVLGKNTLFSAYSQSHTHIPLQLLSRRKEYDIAAIPKQ